MNPIKDLVSIIMPVHTASSSLKRSLESLFAQTYKDWELIMVNDAFSDESKAIIEPYLEKDKRLKWIDMKQNNGIEKTRNIALDRARGQYIAFMDPSDTWDTGKLEKQLKFMTANAYGFSFTGYRTTKGRIVKALPVLNTKELIVNNSIGYLTVIIDRRSTGDFVMPEAKSGQDHLTWLMLMKQGIKAYGLNEILATTNEENVKSTPTYKLRSARSQWEIYRCKLGLSFIMSSIYFIQYVYHSIKNTGFNS